MVHALCAPRLVKVVHIPAFDCRLPILWLPHIPLNYNHYLDATFSHGLQLEAVLGDKEYAGI